MECIYSQNPGQSGSASYPWSFACLFSDPSTGSSSAMYCRVKSPAKDASQDPFPTISFSQWEAHVWDWRASGKEEPGFSPSPLSFKKHLQQWLHVCGSSSSQSATFFEAPALKGSPGSKNVYYFCPPFPYVLCSFFFSHPWGVCPAHFPFRLLQRFYLFVLKYFIYF